ncbi:hypothetical protein [Dyadobacter sandarakinus]|nr:hypothetical protein [Dyadobacter sandarakinus]
MKTCKLWDVDHVRPEGAAPVVLRFRDVEIKAAAVQADVTK